MVNIVLTSTDSNFTQKYGSSGIRVDKQKYSNYQLFYRFDHKVNPPDASNIDICKDENCKTKLRLDKGSTYKGKKLINVHVYFNKYDTDFKNPLIIVLLFKDEGTKVDNKYYKSSEFNSKLTRGETVNITSFTKYSTENSILEVLLQENDKLTDLLTYDIDMKLGDYSVTSEKSYNGDKIKVIDVSNSLNNLKNLGFKKYKHTPQGSHTTKNSCIIYNSDLLYGDDKSPIDDLHNKKYDHICVFCSDNVGEPFLIELTISKTRAKTIDYYYYFRSDENFLCWKKIKKGDTVFSVKFDSSDIYSQLARQAERKLSPLLKDLRSQFQKTLFLIVDKKDNYDVGQIKSLFPESKKFNLINQSINPTNITKSEGQCLDKYGYNVYEHDFSTSVDDISHGEKPQLKFIIHTNTGQRYNEITLYSKDSTQQRDVESLDYSSLDKKLYVYYYGDDPRPLLLCINDRTYKPKRTGDPDQTNQVKVNYTQWVKVSDISNCTCQNGGTGSPNDKLLQALNDVVGFLNPVELNINKLPDNTSSQISKPPNKTTYILHNYTNTHTIKMKISSKTSYCYNIYSYEPDGTNTIGEGFRLGSVLYNGETNKKGKVSYADGNHKYYPLSKVSCYYFKADNTFTNPLLVMLEFKSDIKEHYKLDNNSNYQWSSLELNKVEGDKLYDELYTLNNNFNSSNSQKPDEKTCKPKSDNTAAIASSTVTTLTVASGVGGGVIYYKYPGLVLSLISKIIPK